MGDMWPSIIAVLGTLAGGAMTFAFQTRLSSKEHAKEVAERHRSEILDAASSLGAAMLTYRHSQLARQHDYLRTRQRSEALSAEVRSARGEAWAALFRIQLLTTDDEVLGKATDAMTKLRALKDVENPSDLDGVGEDGRRAIRAFVESTRQRLLVNP